MLDPNTIPRDTLNGMDSFDTAESENFGKSASHRPNPGSSFKAGEFSVAELYGCICHRPTTKIYTSPISLDATPSVTAVRAPSEGNRITLSS